MATMLVLPDAVHEAEMMDAPRIVFLVDLGDRIGVGHLARSSTIALAARPRARSILLVQGSSPARLDHWFERFDEVKIVSPQDMRNSDTLARLSFASSGTNVTVVDGPVSAVLVSRLPTPPATVVLIDDGPGRAVNADIVVNPNLAANTSGYLVRPNGRILAGPRYSLVERDFRQHHRQPNLVPEIARRVLVTCGGADPAGMTARYLRALSSSAQSFDVTAVIGPLTRGRRQLTRLASDLGADTIVAPRSLGGLAPSADLALTTLGTTAAELAAAGVPNLAVAVTEPQLSHLREYAALGIVVPLGWHADLAQAAISAEVESLANSANRRLEMRSAGMRLVDTYGPERVADGILDAVAPAS